MVNNPTQEIVRYGAIAYAGRVLPRAKYNASSAAKELRALLADESYTTRAAEVGRQIRSEDGASAAADEIEVAGPEGTRGLRDGAIHALPLRIETPALVRRLAGPGGRERLMLGPR